MNEYRNWAKRLLTEEHVPSIYDWQNMTVSEMADRALALCAEARDAPAANRGDSIPVIYAFQCLEAMAKAMKLRYPPPRTNNWTHY